MPTSYQGVNVQFITGLLSGMAVGGGIGSGGHSVKNKHTVIFKNGIETLQTSTNVPFGGTVVYTGELPEREGYIFKSWEPPPVNVIENLICQPHFEHIPWPTLLIHSDPLAIYAEAKCEQYDSLSSSWGGLSLVGQSDYSVEADGSIRMSAMGQYAYYPLQTSDTPFTMYMVAKSNSVSNGSFRTMTATYANSSGNAPVFFRHNSNIWTSAYYQDTDSGVRADTIHVMAIAVQRPGSGYYYLDGQLISTKSIGHSGASLNFGGEPNQYDLHDDISIYYAAAVGEAESGDTIIANMQNIMEYYSIN